MKILFISKYSPDTEENVSGPQAVTKNLYNIMQKKKIEVKIFSYKQYGENKLTAIIKSFFYLYKIRNEFDLINIDSSSLNFALIVGLFHFFISCPIVLTIHGSPYDEKSKKGIRQKKLEFFTDLCLRTYKNIITVSLFQRNRLIQHHNLCKKRIESIYSIHNGVNQLFLDSAELTNQRENILKLLMVGGIKSCKGIFFLLKSLEQMSINVPWQMVIAGNTDIEENEKRFWKFVKDYGLTSNIEHKKWLSAVDLVTLYSNCDVVLAPSRFDSFNVSVLEGMAIGKIVVTTYSTGASELISNWHDGIVINYNDTIELCQVLEKIFYNDELKKKIGENAKVTAEKYKWENIASKYIRTYKDIIRDHSRKKIISG